MNAPRYRFAPSPTGFFHVGGARTALFNWALARQQGGTFVLRIEDTDEARNRPEWTQGIIDSLAWIGISADDPHFEGPLFQSSFVGEHLAAAARLFESGDAYYCEMTPDEIRARAEQEGATGYAGWSRDLGLGPGAGRVLRFRVPAGTTLVHDLVRGDVEFDNTTIEDFVLVRGNGTPVFILANVVDDVSMRITHVVRAEEHLPNTPKQQMLWDALGHPSPVWAHVPVLVNEQRKKLSKRRDKVALEQYRDEGYLADAMVNYLMTLGWSPGDTEIVPWPTIEPAFRLEDVNKSPAFFDLKKLAAFNGEYIRMLSVDELVDACGPWLPAEWDRARFAQIAPHIQQRLVTLADAPGVVDFLFTAEPEIDQESWDKAFAPEFALPLLGQVIDAYATAEWDHAALKATMERLMEQYDIKLGKASAATRVAVTGRSVGPPLFEALEVLGRQETLRRLRAARARLV
jgi:glutamyl-tRNA synthetase